MVANGLGTPERRNGLILSDICLLVLGLFLFLSGFTLTRTLEFRGWARSVMLIWGAVVALIALRNLSADRRPARA